MGIFAGGGKRSMDTLNNNNNDDENDDTKVADEDLVGSSKSQSFDQ